MSARLKRYKEAKQLRKEGKYNGAPLFHAFPRLGGLVPVIPKGMQIMTLAGSGIGKSQSWIGITLLTVYKLIKQHNYQAKIYIFLLEDPKELFEDRLFCRVLHIVSKKKYSIDPMELNSMREKPVSEEIESYFEKVDEIVEDIMSYCVIFDSLYKPTAIYKTLRTLSAEKGEHIWETRHFEYKKKDGSTYTEPTRVYKEYVPKDPTLHNIVIIDNLNNLGEEGSDGSVRKSMNKWCRDYARLQICKHWNWSVWNICQTSLDTDKKQFDNRGGSILEKLEPNLSSLGDSKIIARDHSLILALFSPARFGIKNYEKYNIGELEDSFRALIILKSNFSVTNKKIPLYFNGATSYFKELPLPDKMTPEVYEKIKLKQY